MLTTLLSAVTETGAGASLELSDHVRKNSLEGALQAVLTGAATAVFEGSLDGTNWVTIATFSASGMVGVDLPRYVRGNCTAYTDGSVTLILDHPPRV